MLGYINLELNEKIIKYGDSPRDGLAYVFYDPIDGKIRIRNSDGATSNIISIKENMLFLDEDMMFDTYTDLMEYSSTNPIIIGTLAVVKPSELYVFRHPEGWSPSVAILRGEDADPRELIDDAAAHLDKTYSSDKVQTLIDALNSLVSGGNDSKDTLENSLHENYFVLTPNSDDVNEVGTWRFYNDILTNDLKFALLKNTGWEDQGSINTFINDKRFNYKNNEIYFTSIDITNPVIGDWRLTFDNTQGSYERFNGQDWISVQKIGSMKTDRVYLDDNLGNSGTHGLIGIEEQQDGTTYNIFRRTSQPGGYEFGSLYKKLWLSSLDIDNYTLATCLQEWDIPHNIDVTEVNYVKEFEFLHTFETGSTYPVFQFTHISFDVDKIVPVRIEMKNGDTILYETVPETDFNAGISDLTTVGWNKYLLNHTVFIITDMVITIKFQFTEHLNLVSKATGTDILPKMIIHGMLVEEHGLQAQPKWIKGKDYSIGDKVSYFGEFYVCNTNGIQGIDFNTNETYWDKIEDKIVTLDSDGYIPSEYLESTATLDRLTNFEMESLQNPEQGDLVYNTDYDKLYYYVNVDWKRVDNIPSFTEAEMDSITSDIGDVVFNTTSESLYYNSPRGWDRLDYIRYTTRSLLSIETEMIPGDIRYLTDEDKMYMYNGIRWSRIDQINNLTVDELNNYTNPDLGEVVYAIEHNSLFVFNGIDWTKISSIDLVTTAQMELNTTPLLGQSVFNTDDSSLYTHNGVSWCLLSGIEFLTTDELDAHGILHNGKMVYNTDTKDILIYTEDRWTKISTIKHYTDVEILTLTPEQGDVIYNAYENSLFVYNGSKWKRLDGFDKLTRVEIDSLVNKSSGDTVYDMTNDKIAFYDGSRWKYTNEIDRLTTSQRILITGELNGYTVYDTDLFDMFEFRNNVWIQK